MNETNLPGTALVTPESVQELDNKLSKLQDNVSDIDRDMAQDRKDLGDMRIAMGTLKQQMEEMRSEVARLQTKTQDAIRISVQAEMSPIHKQIDELQKTLESFVIDKKKIIYFNPQRSSLFQFISKLFKHE